MKKAKMITTCLMMLCFVFSLLPQGLAATSLPNSVYIAAQITNGCTIASAAMVMRSRAYYSGYSNWTQITDAAIKSVAWESGVGLAGTFSYEFAGNSITMKSQTVNSGFTTESLKQLLNQHPEGVALYCTSMPHAVFLTDYDGDTFYCADPYGGSYSGKRIPLTSSRLGEHYGSQTNILNNAKKYWYISSYSIEPTVPDNDPPVITAGAVTQCSTSNFAVTCDATDNQSISNIQLAVWNDSIGIQNAKWQSVNVVGNNISYTFSVNLADFNNEINTVYHANAFAFDYSGNRSDVFRVADIFIETEKPVVTIARIENITPTSYEVFCKAVDNGTMYKLQIGTWYENEIDSAVWQTSDPFTDEVRFYVSTDYFSGIQNVTYHTNVYAYDLCGNVSSAVKAGDVFLETTPPTIGEFRVENITGNGYDVVINASDNSFISKLQIGTWHSGMSVDNAIWQEVDVYPNHETTASASFHIDVEDFDFARNVTYWTNAYAFDECGNVSDAKKVASVNITYPALEKPDLILPSDLTIIEDEAFSGISASAVLIPKTVVSIIGDPFKNSQVSDIFGYADSAAEKYAGIYGYNFWIIDDKWMKDN